MKRLLFLFLFFNIGLISYGQISTVFSNPLNLAAMTIHNNNLYVGQLIYGRIFKIDLTTSSSTQFAQLDGNINDFFVFNNYLYASIRVYTASTPIATNRVVKINLNQSNPVIENVFDFPIISGIYINNSNLYFNSLNKIYVYDLVNNNVPVLIANDLNTQSYGAYGLLVIDGYLFVTDNDKIVKYNLAIPNSPKIVVTTGIINGCYKGISFSESTNFIYLSGENSQNIIKVNITDGSYSTLTTTTPRSTWEVFYLNNFLYVSSGIDEVYKINLNELEIVDFHENKIAKMYPNPSSNYVNLNDCTFISLFEVSGKKINVNHSESTIDVSNLSRGIYIVKVRDNNDKLIDFKLVKA